uniref:Signal recognition particle 19 kDa protein n=1 Tax=Hucho hucho TaxID=62062 RepID=A0A4W5MZU8_9TELE
MSPLSDNPAEKERFICIYPSYVNSKKTLAEGRRIPAEKVNQICSNLLIYLVQIHGGRLINKMYSREWNRDVTFRGRVRVQLKQEDGTLCSDKFASRKDVMIYCAEMIPKLKTRTQKGAGADSGSQQGEGSKKSKKKRK